MVVHDCSWVLSSSNNDPSSIIWRASFSRLHTSYFSNTSDWQVSLKANAHKAAHTEHDIAVHVAAIVSMCLTPFCNSFRCLMPCSNRVAPDAIPKKHHQACYALCISCSLRGSSSPGCCVQAVCQAVHPLDNLLPMGNVRGSVHWKSWEAAGFQLHTGMLLGLLQHCVYLASNLCNSIQQSESSSSLVLTCRIDMQNQLPVSQYRRGVYCH